MNRVCDLAPTRALSLVPGWTVLPSLPSFQGVPCSGNMLLPATTWDLHIPGESFSERHRRQAAAGGGSPSRPRKRRGGVVRAAFVDKPRPRRSALRARSSGTVWRWPARKQPPAGSGVGIYSTPKTAAPGKFHSRRRETPPYVAGIRQTTCMRACR